MTLPGSFPPARPSDAGVDVAIAEFNRAVGDGALPLTHWSAMRAAIVAYCAVDVAPLLARLEEAESTDLGLREKYDGMRAEREALRDLERASGRVTVAAFTSDAHWSEFRVAQSAARRVLRKP